MKGGGEESEDAEELMKEVNDLLDGYAGVTREGHGGVRGEGIGGVSSDAHGANTN